MKQVKKDSFRQTIAGPDVPGKLGFWGLTALVFGLVVGVSVFNLPQTLAAEASPMGVALAWLITAAGILPLVVGFQYLSDRFPQYNAGLYQYAQAGFGNFVGFNIAWGYWLCSAFSNVTFAVMLNDTVGAFFPPLMNHGWETVLLSSALIWTMYWIVSRGIQTAKIVNTLLAIIKVVMIIFIIVVFALLFKFDLFREAWSQPSPEIGSAWDQIRNCMMITLFCFFGIEGANMMSARARSHRDVGRAGIVGFLLAIVLYMALTLLCFGLMRRAELASLPDPSIAYIMGQTCGSWAEWFVLGAVIISLLGGWVAWTLVVSQVPYEAAVVEILPRIFRRVNRHNMPTFGMAASSVAMELFLLIVVMADNVYLAALHITGLMIIPCYFFTALFMLKKGTDTKIRWIAWIATIFCAWMAYAGGVQDLVMTSGFYLAGIGFYIKARREQEGPQARLFSRGDRIAIGILSVATIYSIVVLLLDYL